jgi:hypothetical protein
MRVVVFREKRGFAAHNARHEMRGLVFASGIPTICIGPVVFLESRRSTSASATVHG